MLFGCAPRFTWLLLLASSSGCMFDAGAFDGAASGTGGSRDTITTSTTGAGGSSGSTGGATSAGGATGGAGAGGATTTTPAECAVDGDCPDPGGLCVGPRCAQGKCVEKPENEGVACDIVKGQCDEGSKCTVGVCMPVYKPTGTVVVGTLPDDCKKRVCDGAGNEMDAPDPNDHLPSDDCTDRSCSGMDPVEMPINIGLSCAFGTGKCCDGLCCIGGGACCPSGSCNYGVCL
ncbi:MAG: hypothetical protein U0441_04525 [Polyangiaceae bacterium]